VLFQTTICGLCPSGSTARKPLIPPPPSAVLYIFPIAAKHRCVISRKRKKREKKRPKKKVRARNKKSMIRNRLKGKKIKNY
jgi:hypothetical protein